MTTILNRHLIVLSVFVAAGFAYLGQKLNMALDPVKNEMLLNIYPVEDKKAFYNAPDGILFKHKNDLPLLTGYDLYVKAPHPLTRSERLVFEKHLNAEDDFYIIKLTVPGTNSKLCLILQ